MLHNGNMIGDLADHGKIVRNEQHRQLRGVRRRSRSSARIWAWTVTSSAVVGSSAIRSCGRLIRAMAIRMRWRWPPENWCGIVAQAELPARAARPRASPPRRELSPPSEEASGDARAGLGDLVPDAHDGVERSHRLLEDHRDVAAAEAAHRRFRQVFKRAAGEAYGAGNSGCWRQQDAAGRARWQTFRSRIRRPGRESRPAGWRRRWNRRRFAGRKQRSAYRLRGARRLASALNDSCTALGGMCV